jgi:hypothetical protein
MTRFEHSFSLWSILSIAKSEKELVADVRASIHVVHETMNRAVMHHSRSILRHVHELFPGLADKFFRITDILR